jgi:hypothetical protein
VSAEVQVGGDNRRGRVGRVLSEVLVVLVAAALGILAAMSIVLTVWLKLGDEGDLTQNMWIFTMSCPSSWPILLGGAAGLAMVVALCRLAWSRGGILDGRRALIVLVVVTTVLQVAWVMLQQTRNCYWGDSWMISAFVDKVMDGGYGALMTGPLVDMDHDARLYFACYPFQSFWFFWCLLMRTVFGDLSLMAIQLVNVLANELTVVCLVLIGHDVLHGAGSRRVLFVLVALCLPLYWLCSYVYGNACGMGLGFLFLLLQVRALTCEDGRRRLVLIAVSAIPLALCLCFKATFVLFAIGALICWVVVALSRRQPLPLVVLVGALLAANLASGVPARVLTQLTGIDTSHGMTTLTHLEMGLRDDMQEFTTAYDEEAATVSPGGWSRHAQNAWAAAGGDAAEQNSTALSEIGEDLSGFASDPAYTFWFFGTKLASEWCDPTFQSLYYSSMVADSSGERFNPVDMDTTLGVTCEGLTYVLDGYETVVFMGAFLACVGMIRRRDLAAPALLLAATFFVGFGCYLLWEEKSVYAFPFLVVILPLAASGVASVFEAIRDGRAGSRPGSEVESSPEGETAGDLPSHEATEVVS